MIEQDTVKLLRECDAGVKMGVQSIDDVMDYVKSEQLGQYLSECRQEHRKLDREIQDVLIARTAHRPDGASGCGC